MRASWSSGGFDPLPLAALLATLALGLAPGRAPAQEEIISVPAEMPDTPGADTLARQVSPGGAFLRSVLIPGWGHASAGAYTRGGFYFAAQTGVGWMLFKTLSNLGAAREVRDARETEARSRFQDQGVTDPDSVEALLEDDEAFQNALGLVEAREEQREDWLALGIFLLLLGGADAFVSAHLADFPEPVEVNTGLAPGRDGVEVRVSIPLGGPGRPR